MPQPLVGIIMGSDSDWPVMQHAAKRLKDFDVPWEARVLSAHRTPDLAVAYAEQASKRGIRCLIAGAGGAAHLAGVLAAKTTLPVLGVPMPANIATAKRAAFAAFASSMAMLAGTDETLARRLADFRKAQADKIQKITLPDPA